MFVPDEIYGTILFWYKIIFSVKDLCILRRVNMLFRDTIDKILRTIELLDDDTMKIVGDNELSWFPNLKMLDLHRNTRITDQSIKNLSLHTLDLCFNNNITDDGIKHLKLHTLGLWNNSLITDEGIKGMQLRVLNLGRNNVITNDAINDMPLSELDLRWNDVITQNERFYDIKILK